MSAHVALGPLLVVPPQAAGGGGGGVVYDTISPDAANTEVDQLTSGAFTISSSANRAVFAFAATSTANAVVPSEVRLGGSGGSALTAIGSALTALGSYEGRAFALAGNASGSQTAYVNLPDSPNEPLCSVLRMVSFTGVHQTTPNGTPVGDSLFIDETGSGSCTVNVSTPNSNERVLCFAIAENLDLGTVTITGASGSTLLDRSDAANVLHEATVTKVASSTTTTIGVTVSGSNATGTGYVEVIAFVVNPA